MQAWVANRYYYQKQIPVKDAAILANLPSASYRRAWISRIYDHDGTADGEGGTVSWLALARAVGLDDAAVLSESAVAPGTRFAVDAYVTFSLKPDGSIDQIKMAAVSPLTDFSFDFHHLALKPTTDVAGYD